MAGPDPATQGRALNAVKLNHEKHEPHEGAPPMSSAERFVFFVKFVVRLVAAVTATLGGRVALRLPGHDEFIVARGWGYGVCALV